jgi:hypothetical protein
MHPLHVHSQEDSLIPSVDGGMVGLRVVMRGMTERSSVEPSADFA